jgi:hypothetical protein
MATALAVGFLSTWVAKHRQIFHYCYEINAVAPYRRKGSIPDVL